jgi:hypothetical protein
MTQRITADELADLLTRFHATGDPARLLEAMPDKTLPAEARFAVAKALAPSFHARSACPTRRRTSAARWPVTCRHAARGARTAMAVFARTSKCAFSDRRRALGRG